VRAESLGNGAGRLAVASPLGDILANLNPDPRAPISIPPPLAKGHSGLRAVADSLRLQPSPGTSAGRPAELSQARSPMARDIGTRLIQPKTPLHRRFDLLNAISSRLEAQAARLRAANPEQVSNLANGMAFPEQFGRPI
jgi:hypothetical protein